jgi:hypothetical protein
MRITDYERKEIAARINGDVRLKRLAIQAEARMGHELSLMDIEDIQNRFIPRHLIK